MSLLSILDRSHSIAKPGFNRWMVPPAALCIHLCIGQVYAFSVFNLPMTKLIGITKSAPDDWKLTELGWIFSIAIFFLGVSAAVFGRWVEEGGPPSWTQRPTRPTPRKKIAIEKIQPSSVSFHAVRRGFGDADQLGHRQIEDAEGIDSADARVSKAPPAEPSSG